MRNPQENPNRLESVQPTGLSRVVSYARGLRNSILENKTQAAAYGLTALASIDCASSAAALFLLQAGDPIRYTTTIMADLGMVVSSVNLYPIGSRLTLSANYLDKAIALTTAATSIAGAAIAHSGQGELVLPGVFTAGAGAMLSILHANANHEVQEMKSQKRAEDAADNRKNIAGITGG